MLTILTAIRAGRVWIANVTLPKRDAEELPVAAIVGPVRDRSALSR